MNFYLDLKDQRLQETARLLNEHYEKLGQQVKTFDLFQNLNKITSEDVCILSPAYKWEKSSFCALPQGVTIFGGNLAHDLQNVASKYNYNNMMAVESFVAENARLTAEGFLAKLVEETDNSIYEQKILITGSGRVAKALWAILSKLGVPFDCCMRNQKELALSTLFCNKSFHLRELRDKLACYDVVINTVPVALFDSDKFFRTGAVLFELSSTRSIAGKVSKIKFVPCPALPAKFSPKTAGKLIYNLVSCSINI